MNVEAKKVTVYLVALTEISEAVVIEWRMGRRDLDAVEEDRELAEVPVEPALFKVEITTTEEAAFLVKLIRGTILRLKIR